MKGKGCRNSGQPWSPEGGKDQGEMELTEPRESWNHKEKPPFGTCDPGCVRLLSETEHESRKEQARPTGEAEMQSVVLNGRERQRFGQE